MQPYKICCITYKTLDTLVRDAIESISDKELEISIIEGLREEIVEKIHEEENGVEVFIGGGANAKIAEKFSAVPVIEYKISPYDYLEAIDKAFLLGESIAIVTYKNQIPPSLEDYIKKIGIPYINIIYETTEELREKIQNCNNTVIIGAAHSVEIAEKLGRKSVLIYSGKSAIVETIIEAKKIAKKLRYNSSQAKFAQAVVNYSSNGIILVNSDGIIIDFNNSAQDIFQKKIAVVKGQMASEIIPECGIIEFLSKGQSEDTTICVITGQDVLCRWIGLPYKNKGFNGTVGVFSKMSEINRANMEYQDKLYRERAEKGFIAKKNFSDIIGSSSLIKECIKEASLIAQSEASVLIYGETGVGKEIFAQSIHNDGPRKNGPFVAINCAALPEDLLESELFGYDEGAFTGGRKGGKKGLFELASGGTIFLDEIGEISPRMQTRLLRVLQEHEIMRIGGDKVISVDVRVISATNKELEYISNESFRRDLYYRLSVLELKLPALRERPSDASVLLHKFYKQEINVSNYNAEFPDIISMIASLYSWPGNIRELQNVCQRFCLYTGGSLEHSEKFLRHCFVKAIGEERLLKDIIKPYDPLEKNISMKLINMLQEIFDYNKTQLSEKIGISRTTLWRSMKNKVKENI